MKLTFLYKKLPSIRDDLKSGFEEFVRVILVSMLKDCLKRHKTYYTSVLNLYKIDFYIILRLVDDLVIVRDFRGGFVITLNNQLECNGYSVEGFFKMVEYGSIITGNPRPYFRNVFKYFESNIQKYALIFKNVRVGVNKYHERLFI